MNWYHYLACFVSGMTLANAVPHFVHGSSGDPFPTPFAKPPGKGLSSPTVNVVWALFNLLLGAQFFHFGELASAELPQFAVFFAGIAVISILSSIAFQKKQTR